MSEGNHLITPEEFTRKVIESMNKAEDEAGLPRGSLIKAWVDQWNERADSVPISNITKPPKIIHYMRVKDKGRFFCGFPKFMGGYYSRHRAGVTCAECKDRLRKQ